MSDLTTRSTTRSTTRFTTTRHRAASVLGAVAATALLWLLATALLEDPLLVPQAGDRADLEVTLPMVVFVAALASLLGWAALAVLERSLDRGRTVWVWLSVAVTALSLLPLATPGTAPATRAVLGLLHLAVAAVIIPGMTRARE